MSALLLRQGLWKGVQGSPSGYYLFGGTSLRLGSGQALRLPTVRQARNDTLVNILFLKVIPITCSFYNAR